MSFFIYRNTTVESFFSNIEARYSGYDDISCIPTDADSFIWFYLLPVRTDLQLLSSEIASFSNSIDLIVKQVPSSKIFYIFTLAPLYTNVVETGNFSLQNSINEFNLKLVTISKVHNNIKIIDFQSFLSIFPSSQLIDWKYYYISRTLLNPRLANDFKNWFTPLQCAIQMKRKKCLVLDLDNTLWSGILGEDGIYDIKIGGDYPGNAFQDFQKSILELYKSGIILTICSKNNESDVTELWEKNPEVLIKKEHLAGFRINWNNKADNIKELADELNIGLDSVVLIDDNPSERELVKQLLPMVEAPEFPSQPYLLPAFIREVTEKYFRIYQLTDEDRNKTKQYHDNALREKQKEGFSDFTEYLTSLQIELEIQRASGPTIPRIAQLTQKTNQFNLTTRRYTEAEIYNFIDLGHVVYSVKVSDKFGDHGITGLIIIKLNRKEKSAEIDSFLLSCRILGKGIEEAFANSVFNEIKIKGIRTLTARFFPTTKNGQVSEFYEKLGFTPYEDNNVAEDGKCYTLNLNKTKFEIKPYFKIRNVNNEGKD